MSVQGFIMSLMHGARGKEAAKALILPDFFGATGAAIVPTVEMTASGAPPLFLANSVGKPLKAWEVNVSPYQDLHGYANPWPAGGGKNKCGIDTISGIKWAISYPALLPYLNSLPAGTYTLSFTLRIDAVEQETNWQYGVYLGVGSASKSNWQTVSDAPVVGNTYPYAFSFTIDSEQAGLFDTVYLYGCGNNQVSAVGTATLLDIQLESGSSATSFAPYENICPINGTNAVTLWTTAHADKWGRLKDIISTGRAAEVYPVGYEFSDEYIYENGKSCDAPWRVLHHRDNGDVVLQWVYATPRSVIFDEREALYYAPAGGLPAGTYHIGIGTNSGSWRTEDHIQFTLTENMDAGDQLYVDAKSDDPTSGVNWYVYAYGSTVVKQSGTTGNGTDGTYLGTTSTENMWYTNGNINSIPRATTGYNRWSQSEVRQWLNSDADAGEWWTPQNPWDRPSERVAQFAGFLAGVDANLKELLSTVAVVTIVNDKEDAAERTEITYDRVFLPSMQEIYAVPIYSNYDEGGDWDYYKNLAKEAGLSGRFNQGVEHAILIKCNAYNTSAHAKWGLRSCTSSVHSNMTVNGLGRVASVYTVGEFQCSPAIIITKSAKPSARVKDVALPQVVYSDTVGSDGIDIKSRCVTLTGNETVVQNNARQFSIQNVISDNYDYTAGGLCTHFTPSIKPLTTNDVDNAIIGRDKDLYIRADQFADAAALKAFLAAQYAAGTPVQYVGTLTARSTAIPLTTTATSTFSGNSGVLATAHDGAIVGMEVAYIKSKQSSVLYEAYNLAFDGTNYIDTGVYLFDDDVKTRDFEFVAEGIVGETANNESLIGCKHDKWRNGFVLRTRDNSSVQFPGTVFMKPNIMGTMIIKRINGHITLSGTNLTNPNVPFNDDGGHHWPLTLGCAIDDDGNPYRFAKGTIEHVVVRWL